MNKKVFGIVMAGALAFGASAVIPTLAATDTVDQPQVNTEENFVCDYSGRGGVGFRGGFEGEGNPMNSDYIKEQADKYGIEIDGRYPRDVMQEVREARLLQEAADFGIETVGKDLSTLALEVHEQKVLKVATELNLDTTNMTTEEITQEIFTNYAEEARELGMFQGKGPGQGLGPNTDFDSQGERGKRQRGGKGGNGMNRWNNAEQASTVEDAL